MGKIRRRERRGGSRRARHNTDRCANRAEVFQRRFQIRKASGDKITDELVDVDVQAEQIRDAPPQAELIVGDQIVAMYGHESGADIDRRIDQDQQVERPALRRRFQRRSGGQVTGDTYDRSLRPGVPDEFHDLEEVVLHAPEREVLKFPVAIAEMIGMVVPQDAKTLRGQVIGEGCIIQRGLSVPGSEDDRGNIGINRFPKVTVHQGNAVASGISAFAGNAENRRRGREQVSCGPCAQILPDEAEEFALSIRAQRLKTDADSGDLPRF